MQYSTRYIIGFAAAVCLVCSIFVAGAAVTLKPRQDANLVLDRQKKVLVVAGLMKEGEGVSAEEVAKRFEDKITPRVVELSTGDYADGAVDAGSYDQRKASKDPAQSRTAPPNRAKVIRVPTYGLVYLVTSESGETESIIIPVEARGLWSTLYGFLALAPDTRVIQGITFYEHGETPGLGGEVDNPRWKALWTGRLAFDDRWNPSISVVKGRAGSVEEDPYQVDGLSGATLTSRGVSDGVRFWLGDSGFGPYLEKVRPDAG